MTLVAESKEATSVDHEPAVKSGVKISVPPWPPSGASEELPTWDTVIPVYIGAQPISGSLLPGREGYWLDHGCPVVVSRTTEHHATGQLAVEEGIRSKLSVYNAGSATSPSRLARVSVKPR